MFSFKLSEVTESSFSPIDPGQYKVQIEDVEEKSTLKGGVSWSFKMKVIDSQRKFFLNYNVENSNKVAEGIARGEVLEIAKAMGLSKDDVSIDSMRTNDIFSITLEQRPVGDKIYYSAKNWKKVGPTMSEAKKMVADTFKEPAKKVPWKT